MMTAETPQDHRDQLCNKAEISHEAMLAQPSPSSGAPAHRLGHNQGFLVTEVLACARQPVLGTNRGGVTMPWVDLGSGWQLR